MVPMNVFIYLPDTPRFLFSSSFEALLEPHRWRYTVQHFVQILCRESVDISAFSDNLCAFSSVASGFSIPHNFQGRIHLSIWIPIFADYVGDSGEDDNQLEINLALVPSLHDSFNGGQGFGAVPAIMEAFHDSFNGGQGFGAVPAIMEAIGRLNTFIVGEEVGDDEDSLVSDVSCAVCLEDIVPGDLACAMPCSHEYHDGCIRRWLEASRICPLCRLALE